MTLRPPRSRSQLEWKVFKQQDDGSWCLHLPPYYADLFEIYFPPLMTKSNTGFRDSTSGKTKYAFFPSLEEGAVSKIQRFLAFFGQAVCLGVNKHLKDDFSDELDFCLSLDFNKPSPAEGRTEIGEWEYRAKQRQDADALGNLAQRLAAAAQRLPRSSITKPRLITYVPPDPGKAFYLPAELAKAVVQIVPDSFWGATDPLVKATLTAAKQSAKNLSVGQKIAQWKKILDARAIRLSRSVQGSSVVVVDDLYQSGASLWSFAKYLKAEQAAVVVGLPCVKSLRDTDNL